jgi:secondary thiamine-phosphate synthase enzyme
MKIINRKITFNTKGSGDFINITDTLSKALKDAAFQIGNVTAFVSGSTAGITTLEYEPGLLKDVGEFYETLAPSNRRYHHDDTWGDANGFSHIRATLTGQSLTIPFEDGRLILGIWQQVVLTEFDNRPRTREITIQIIGE